ncbi:MAG TPA: type IV toxin-antitoxin system AbiEi family antitoxin domain-containing protein [Solirubrobacteraceae bacterium]|nr:type IV toxin-antitoxin system AbiEi family antitoxin domain-containing protein [Solirubrobacteraceae bacterium]
MDVIDRSIAAVAAKQSGNITRRQLLGLGLSSTAIDARITRGRLYRVLPGVYHVGAPAITPLERAAAAVLAGGDAALSHGSGMSHWGFWERWEIPFEVTLLSGHRSPKGIRIHRVRTIDRHDTTVHRGIRVTKPARTLFDIASRLTDKQLARTVNDALHTPWLTRDHLAEQLQRHPQHLAAKRILPFITATHGPTRSDWERTFPAFCLRWDLPAPVMGYRIARRTVDAFWPNERIIIELDSLKYHLNEFAFADDRDRDKDHLTLRLHTVRITWEEMHETPATEAARLKAIIAAWS